jgi:pimeloyl-ACP methyl ester carboxylesterase
MRTWILLRGLARESRHWGDFVEKFQRALPDQRVVLLDLPGNGVFNLQGSPWRVMDMVEHCRSQLASQSIPAPYHLLTLSLGGMVAVAWAQAYSQEVLAQVLINTSMRPFCSFYQRLRPANFLDLLTLLLHFGGSRQWERTVLNMTSNCKDESVLPHWVAVQMSRPVSRVNAFRQLLAAARFRATQDPPPVPTLLLASELDRLVSVQCSKSMANHWHCPLQVHDSAGHDLPLDDGAWVAQQVEKWIMTGVSCICH